jgi:hypothetical protein
MAGESVIERLRKPEYTGVNRCIPCTVVNLGLAFGAAVAVQVAVVLTRGEASVAILGSLTVLSVSVAAIYLRGYLVPGTPWLTATLFPDWLLRRFDKRPERGVPVWGSVHDDPIGDGFDAEATLAEMGVASGDAQADGGTGEDRTPTDDRGLTDEFLSTWRDRVADARRGDAPRTDLARVLDVDPDDLSVTGQGDVFEAHVDGRQIGEWNSRAAVLADVATAAVLDERTGAWDDLAVGERGRVLRAVRARLDHCPACESEIERGRAVGESCCPHVEVVRATCRSCGARVFERERPAGE